MSKIFVSFNILFLFLTIALYSCKGKEGAPGPVGPKGEPGPTGAQGPQGASYNPDLIWTKKEGSITARVKGTTNDNTPYDWNIDFQGVSTSNDNFYFNTQQGTIVRIFKTYAVEGEAFTRAYLDITFSVPSLTNTATATLISAEFHAVKDLGNGKLFAADRELDVEGGINILNNVTYNAATQTISGDFGFNFPRDLSGGDFTITNGKFTSKLTQVVARVAE